MQQLVTSAQTGVVTASAGTADDVEPGIVIVIRYTPGSQTEAEEIVVLPSSSDRGLPIVETEGE